MYSKCISSIAATHSPDAAVVRQTLRAESRQGIARMLLLQDSTGLLNPDADVLDQLAQDRHKNAIDFQAMAAGRSKKAHAKYWTCLH